MLGTTSTTTTWNGALGDIWDRALNFIDYSIDDAFGQLNVPSWNPFGLEGNPEQVAPNTDPPQDTVPGGAGSGSTLTYVGVGLLLAGGAYLLYKAVK